jgi:virulence-associated protein VagC
MPQKATKAKVFMNGRSQAVRIPAEFHFRLSEVSIRRDPASGAVILSEGPGTWAEVLHDWTLPIFSRTSCQRSSAIHARQRDDDRPARRATDPP